MTSPVKSVETLTPDARLTRLQAAEYIPQKSTGKAVSNTIVGRCLTELSDLHPMTGLIENDLLTPEGIRRIIKFRGDRTAYKRTYRVEMDRPESEPITVPSEPVAETTPTYAITTPQTNSYTIAQPPTFSAENHRQSASSALAQWEQLQAQMAQGSRQMEVNASEVDSAAGSIGRQLGAQMLMQISQEASQVVVQGMPIIQSQILQMLSGNASGSDAPAA